jgi:hypothetical protein
MESETNSFEALFGRAGDYFETRLELIRLKSVDKSAGVVSSFASRLTVGLIILIAVIIISIGVSLWVGEYFGNAYYGFFIVGGVYLLIGFIVFLLRKLLLKNPVEDLFIDKVLN